MISRILPDVAAFVADHGLVAELQDVVWDEHGEVGRDQAGDGHVTYPDPGPLYMAGGDHGDRPEV